MYILTRSHSIVSVSRKGVQVGDYWIKLIIFYKNQSIYAKVYLGFYFGAFLPVTLLNQPLNPPTLFFYYSIALPPFFIL